ncbi:MAG: HNH endonuclease [Microcoleaceae cyanobacterium]
MSQKQQSRDNRTVIDYCDRFAELKVNRTRKRGNAPYKPILLLSIIELIAQGKIQENKILISDLLVETFDKYWNILNSETFNGGLALPFFHLKNEERRFWYLQYSEEYDGGRPQTLKKIREDVEYAYMDEELFDLIQTSESRKELIDSLVSAWFSTKESELQEIIKANQDFQDSSEVEINEPRYSLKKSLIRNAFFRKAVVHLYNYHCAFCGLKVSRTLSQNIVDGAHIKPLSKFYDNQLNNGISFCKNHHWAFDRGLFTIDEKYNIVVSDNFEEISPNTKPIKEFQGLSIQLPNEKSHYPRLEAIEWHQNNVFIS